MKNLLIRFVRLVKKVTFPFATERIKDITFSGSLNYLASKNPFPQIIVDRNNTLDITYDLHIIIPVYNVEKYVKECVDSVINQKTRYRYFVTIVNDGSTDNSSLIIEEYRNLENIQIINQVNKGASGARNAGLETIRGRYLLFLDSDDVLEEGAIDAMVDKAIDFDADVVQCGYYRFDDKGVTDDIVSFKESVSESDTVETIPGFAGMKVIKAELFSNLIFPEKLWFEDTILEYCIFPVCKKKYTTEKIGYGYRVNNLGSSSTSRYSNKAIDHFYLLGFLWDRCVQKGFLSIEVQMSCINGMVLGYYRTKNLEKDICVNGFMYLRERYVNMFPKGKNYAKEMMLKYRLVDSMIRRRDFGCFCAYLNSFEFFD